MKVTDPTGLAVRLTTRPIGATALASLNEFGWCSIPEWLDGPSMAAVLSDAIGLDEAGCSREAAIGASDERGLNTQIRRSRLCPLYPPPPPSAGSIDTRVALYSAADALRAELQSAVGLELPQLHPFRTELSYLYYPEGGFYRRHLDVPRGNGGWHLRTRRPGEKPSPALCIVLTADFETRASPFILCELATL